MPEYLIAFNAEWVPNLTDEDLREASRAASALRAEMKAAGVLIFYVVYQEIENAFLTPKIMKSTVDLPALAVIIALALGGSIAGVLGALVAVPTAALIAVIMSRRDHYLVGMITAIGARQDFVNEGSRGPRM